MPATKARLKATLQVEAISIFCRECGEAHAEPRSGRLHWYVGELPGKHVKFECFTCGARNRITIPKSIYGR